MIVRRGLTLAELLIVVAIIGVLSGLILPAVSLVRRAVVRTACASNLGQVAIAVTAYASDYDGRLPAEGNFGDDHRTTSPAWFYRLPPYFDSSDVRGRSVFQCAGFTWRGARIFDHASPKSFKLNAYLDNEGRPRHFQLGSVSDEAELVLFIDAVAGETGMGQWGYAVPAAVDDSRHRGHVNVLHADGHSCASVTTPADGDWREALRWTSEDWIRTPPARR